MNLALGNYSATTTTKIVRTLSALTIFRSYTSNYFLAHFDLFFTRRSCLEIPPKKNSQKWSDCLSVWTEKIGTLFAFFVRKFIRPNIFWCLKYFQPFIFWTIFPSVNLEQSFYVCHELGSVSNRYS